MRGLGPQLLHVSESNGVPEDRRMHHIDHDDQPARRLRPSRRQDMQMVAGAALRRAATVAT